MNEQIDDYRRLFVDDVPLLDVRAPAEFAKGAFPGAHNRPLLDDDERRQVGIAYKEGGNGSALDVGHALIRGAIKADRVSAWHAFADMHPGGALYCFRGGQRSEIAQRWLYEDGAEYPRVRGGYKAMRSFLIDTIERLGGAFDLSLIGGRTGVGKTELLLELPRIIDLEGRANHRGSGFGRRVTPQPTQIDFENALAIDLLKHEAADVKALVLEDESRCIGARNIPDPLWNAMAAAAVVLCEEAIDDRIERIRREYVEDQLEDFRAHYAEAEGAEAAFEHFAEHLRASLQRISRRVGDERYGALAKLMDQALAEQARGVGAEAHGAWIERLLVDYYDPMYDYQIRNKGERIAFVGERAAVRDYLLRT